MQETEQLSSIIQEEIQRAKEALRKGRVLLYPTDTVWGLGCDIHNESAVKRIYEIKQRPSDKPFVLLVHSIEMLKKYIERIHPRIETLLTHHVQPLTIIYKANDLLPDYLLSEERTVAIRVTHDPFCKHLIQLIDKPLISTSANVSGVPYPNSYEDIEERVIEMADDVINPELERDAIPHYPSVIATFNHKGELNFIRT